MELPVLHRIGPREKQDGLHGTRELCGPDDQGVGPGRGGCICLHHPGRPGGGAGQLWTLVERPVAEQRSSWSQPSVMREPGQLPVRKKPATNTPAPKDGRGAPLGRAGMGAGQTLP